MASNYKSNQLLAISWIFNHLKLLLKIEISMKFQKVKKAEIFNLNNFPENMTEIIPKLISLSPVIRRSRKYLGRSVLTVPGLHTGPGALLKLLKFTFLANK